MVNAWSLAYDVLNGTLDEEYPIMNKEKVVLGGDDTLRVTPLESDEYDPPSTLAATGTTVYGGGGSDTLSVKGAGDYVPFSSSAFGAADTLSIDQSWWEDDGFSMTGNPAGSSQDTINLGSYLPGGMGEDRISFTAPPYDPLMATIRSKQGDGVDSLYLNPVDPATTYKPQPDLTNTSPHKYQEDKGIEDLKDYVTSTYQGHYTNKNSDVQTLDLIHSVGDAESFCRSNALKYLSRYDKKGSAKNDILKAMHYCLLLYYFSGNTQEPDYTNPRYETF